MSIDTFAAEATRVHGYLALALSTLAITAEYASDQSLLSTLAIMREYGPEHTYSVHVSAPSQCAAPVCIREAVCIGRVATERESSRHCHAVAEWNNSCSDS